MCDVGSRASFADQFDGQWRLRVSEKCGNKRLVAAEVAALTKGVLKAMQLSKIKTGSLLLVIGAAIGIGLLAYSAEAPQMLQAEKAVATQKRATPREQTNRGQGSKKVLEELDWALTKVDTEKSRISALRAGPGTRLLMTNSLARASNRTSLVFQ